MTDTDLAVRAPNSLALAEEMYSEEQRAQIAEFLGIKPDDHALVPFLAIAAQLGLDPFTGEIWLIDTTKRIQKDGQWQDGPRKLTPAVGRDGLLKIARDRTRTEGYLGYRSDVHCERDTFHVEHHDGSDSPSVRHSYSGAGPEMRGEIQGAWCKVRMRGQDPTFYYAPLREHGKVGQRNGSPYWQGAWAYTHAMILKAAVSYAHRLAIGVSGFVPADELGEHGPITDSEASEMPSVEDELRELLDAERVPEDLADALAEAIARVNELAPFFWGPAKIQMRLKGRGKEGAAEALEELRGEIESMEATAATETAEADATVILRAEDVVPGQVITLGDAIEAEEVVEVAPYLSAEDPDDHRIEITFAESGPLVLDPGEELELVRDAPTD